MKFSMWASNNRAWSEIVDLATYVESVGGTASGCPTTTCRTLPTSHQSGAYARLLDGARRGRRAVPNLQLTSMVSPVTIHHPVVLAKRVVTVDQISNGRAVMGLGAGWQVNEHRGYGFELREPGERVTHFIEAFASSTNCSTTSAPTSPVVVHVDGRDVRAKAGAIARCRSSSEQTARGCCAPWRVTGTRGTRGAPGLSPLSPSDSGGM